MRRPAICLLVLGLPGMKPAAAAVPQIRHVIIIVQENRSVDNFFHGLDAYVPGVDVVSSGMASTGAVVPLAPISLTAPFDMSHAYIQFHSQYNNGAMNGADLTTCVPAIGTASCPAYPAFTYVQQTDVQPLFDMATQYGFANRMFQTNRGPSLPAHLQLLSGSDEPIANSNLDAGNNYNGTATDSLSKVSGCASPATKTLELVGPSGKVVQNVFPCFEHATLPDVLDAPNGNASLAVSWRYYTNSVNGILDAPNAIRHLCQPQMVRKAIKCTGPHFKDGHIVANSAQVLSDILSNNLQTVTWVNPPPTASDHPVGNNGSGPSWVAAIVNTVGQSQYWANTAILVTWDDWGGFYDHVSPPNDPARGYYDYGFRVPLLVISPYTPAGYVSNVTHDFGSILKFVETVFGLPLIPPGTFNDSKADDLTDFFNFNAAPRGFTPISAPYPVSYFLKLQVDQAKHPESVPDDPTDVKAFFKPNTQ